MSRVMGARDSNQDDDDDDDEWMDGWGRKGWENRLVAWMSVNCDAITSKNGRR